MLTILSGEFSATKKSANGCIKALRVAGLDKQDFSIEHNGKLVAAVYNHGTPLCTVLIDGKPIRTIAAKDALQTARLYADANRLRGHLDNPSPMVIG